jgi:hypothetical protein
MFGYSGGESAETVARKRADMADAQRRWPFFTNFDASTIKTEEQLVSLVKDRTGRSRDEAQRDVQAWSRERLSRVP